MFKIESYITPIILKNVEKYIKNIRPQDSQVSLWGGEVAFQNLDLRLDVLEEELQLPFNLLSGHIHELIIHVPWTKIASEPISITINTIEFVLKLKNPNDPNVWKHEKRKKSSRYEDIQAPPGYMASLVNKIANNVSIKCNNIVLKYVEEDIVVSMNIQLLSFDSADSDWNPAFIDISPINVFMRKVINIKDLTICLDKRNSIGKIDICQEPILYRCTFQLRMLRIYNSSTAHRSSITRMDLHTNSLNLNISTQQFPMVMRLLYLGLNLKRGTIKSRNESNTPSDHNLESEGNDYDQQSYFSWAWDMLPSFFPSETTSDDYEEIKGHVLHTGIYIDKLKLVFKSQEIFGDPIVCATKKIKYVPFLKIVLCGIYCDTISLGSRWFNLKGGISSIGVYPVGDCTCGSKNNSKSFLTSIENNENLHYMNTLIDSTGMENMGKNPKYNFSWDAHMMNVTDEELLNKTPALAFDLLHQIEIPEDMGRSSELGSDLEYSNLSEKTVIRVIVGPLKCYFDVTLYHIYETLKQYFQLYDYPPYIEEKLPLTLSQLSPPSTDDYDALMAEIPLVLIQMTVTNFIFELHISDHKKLSTTKKHSIGQRSLNNMSSKEIFFLSLEIDKIEINKVSPLYPNRLVFTTCQLPAPPINLFERCYDKIDLSFKNILLFLNNDNSKTNIINIGGISTTVKDLIRPDLWIKTEIHHQNCNINLKNINFIFNKPQLHLVSTIMDSISQMKFDISFEQFNYTLLNEVNNKGFPVVDILLESIQFKYVKNQILHSCCFDIDKILGYSYIPKICDNDSVNERKLKKSVILSGPDCLNLKDLVVDNLLSIIIQLPLKLDNVTTAPIFLLKLGEITVSIDSMLSSFFSYDIKIQEFEDVAIIPETIHESDSLKKINIDKKIKKVPRNLESIHSSSEKDTTTIVAKQEGTSIEKKGKAQFSFLKYFKIFNCLMLSIEIRQCTILMPTERILPEENLTNLMDLLQHLAKLDLAVFKLPFINISSSQSKSTAAFFAQNIPITIPRTLWNIDRESFPWSMSLWGFMIYSIQNQKSFTLIEPLKTNITLAITCKEEAESKYRDEINTLVSMCFHIDTAPTVVNLYAKQVSFLYVMINNLLSLPAVENLYPKIEKVSQPLEIAQRPVSPDINVDLKEFFGITNTSSSTKETMTIIENQINDENEQLNSLKLSVLLQWTFTKFTTNLFGERPGKECKLVIDCEDIISSLDKQNIYVKIKNKIGSISSEYYEKFSISDHWVLNESLGFNMKTEPNLNTESTNDTFFDFVLTTAETGNVHSKWGITKRDKSLNDYLTEIMMTMQQIDFFLDLELLSTFIPIFKIFQKQETTTKKPINENALCVADIPLIYFESKGFRIFIPTPNKNEKCNVLIIKVNQVVASPNVDNPITRIPVRPDIYTKAAQLRILNSRGSKIEDRQYEFLIKGISMATGSWKQVSTFVESNNAPGILHENPAFEWNNKQNAKTAIDINTIFNDFNFSIIFAPSIIFKNVLVCGPGLELNCLTDLTIDVNSLQISLGKHISEKLIYLSNIFNSQCDDYQKYSHLKIKVNSSLMDNSSNIEISTSFSCEDIIKQNENQKKLQDATMDSISAENVLTDSGIGSQKNFVKSKSLLSLNKKFTINENSIKNQILQHKIPFEIWFIGGVFTANLYHISNKTSNRKDQKNDLLLYFPLISLSIYQPNMMISRTIFETTIQMSIFDVLLCLGSDPEILKATNNKFTDIVFKTKQGDLDLHGIPQSLVKIKYHQNVVKDSNVDIEFKRPIKINFSHKTLEKIFSLKQNLDKILNTDKLVLEQLELKPITKNVFNMKSITSNLHGIRRLNFSSSQLIIQLSNLSEYNLTFSFTKLHVKLEYLERPEKIIFNILLKSIMMNTDKLIVLHPLTLDLFGNLQQDSWNKFPSIFFALKSNCILIEFGPENILHILKLREAFMKTINWYLEELETINRTNKKSLKEDKTNYIDNLQEIPLQQPKLNRKSKSLDEYYQDDLRAGAFQFIEAHTETDMPLPYQILIINKENGLICWRYPQPRALNNIEVFPVPFHTTTGIKIKCKLEYYSEAQSIFLPYCTFDLSESDSNVINLPKSKVTSSIWRVVMIQSMVAVNSTFFEEEYDEDPCRPNSLQIKNIDEILQKSTEHVPEDYLEDEIRESIFHLHPQILVACMKVDSIFSPTLVPNLQSIINISQIQINLVNHLQSKPSPDIIKEYEIINDFSPWQTFLTFYFKNFKIHTNMYTDLQLSINTEFNFSTEILDYSYLSMQPLIEEYYLESSIDLSDVTNLNFVGTELKIRYGPSFGHTLAISEQIWRQWLTNEIDKHIIASRYIICNTTNTLIKLGQTETDEAIFLKSKQCCFYAFRSEKFEQNLTFYVDENFWYPSNPIEISDDGLKYSYVEKDKIFVIKTEKISTTQKKITVKGQVEFMNMTMHTFYVNYKNNDKSIDFELLSKLNTSVFGICDAKCNQTIRIKLAGPNRKGWSGEIPLQKSGKNNAPWLVKVPTNTKQNFSSFWIRVIREDITEVSTKNGFIPQKVLVIIWPLFMIKSMLSVDIIANDNENEDILIPGKGEIKELNLPGTHEDEHELVFKMNFISPQGEEKNRALLSYKLIDKNDFFAISNKYNTIEKVLDELNKPQEGKWPCSREEELLWNLESSAQDVIMPIYNCSLSRDLSCSLMLTILPWCLFINSTGISIKLTSTDGNISNILNPNNISMPLVMSDAFQISIEDNVSWKSSPIIYLNQSAKINKSDHILPEDGNVVFMINTAHGVSKLVLKSSNENGVKILILSTFYVVSNFTTYDIHGFMYAIYDKKNEDIIFPDAFHNTGTYDIYKNYKNSLNSSSNRLLGTPINNFFNLSSNELNDRNEISKYRFFASLQSSDRSVFSCPIILNNAFNRKSINITVNEENIPISLSLLEHNQQMFLSIYFDCNPEISIENFTNLRIYVAQSQTLQSSSTAAADALNCHFKYYQIVEPISKIFYTPFCVDDRFPEIINYEYGIIFAVVDDSNIIKWTTPIKINQTKDVFLKMPKYGDLKLSINCESKISTLRIEYISETQEFCVKDIRSRLSNPNKNESNISNEQSSSKLNITDVYKEFEESHEKQRNTQTTISSGKKLKLNLYTKEISLLLFSDVDKKLSFKSELISLCCDDVAIVYDDIRRELNFGCSNFQIDNLRYPTKQYDFPVVLCPQENIHKHITIISSFSLNNEITNCFDNQLIKISIKFYKNEFATETIKLSIKPIRAYLEDTYLNFVFDYILESLPNNLIYYEKYKEKEFRINCDNEKAVLIPLYIEKHSLHLSESFKLKSITFDPLNILLSVHTCLRMYIALDHSPLQFSTFKRQNINTLPMKFGYVLGKHYLEGAAIGAGWVVGSLEILGSPGGLARSVSTGIRDFVSMPVQGLLRGPWGFLVGITQGSASLIRNVTAGTVNSVTKLAASVSRNLDWLTHDEQHLMITDSIRRSRPQGITEGFAQGMTGLGISLLGAVGGLARHPLEARTTAQVITGVGKGIVGAFAKPISGAAELLALTGQGMLQSVGYNTLPIPRSLPSVKNTTISPATCKIPWKFLEPSFSTDMILFSSLATLNTKSGLKSVLICLTSNILTFLSLEKDELLEILSIEKIRGYIDENDPSLIVLKTVSHQSPETSSTSTIDDSGRIIISPRTYQFVRDSTEQLPIFSLQQLTEPNLDYNDFQNNESQQKIEFYMTPCLAEYFIRYISLIKRCINPNPVLFSPLENL